MAVAVTVVTMVAVVAVVAAAVAAVPSMAATAAATATVAVVAATGGAGAAAPARVAGVGGSAGARVCGDGAGGGAGRGRAVPLGQLGEHLALQGDGDPRQDGAAGVLELGDEAPAEHAQLPVVVGGWEVGHIYKMRIKWGKVGIGDG